jgi:hypothetical protein
MGSANRPPTLVRGWEGAWGINVRRALVALRDEGPLTLTEVAEVMRRTALHADLTSGHTLGPDHGALMLAQAILEDAAAVITVDGDRFTIPLGMTSFVSPFSGETLRLLTADEQAAAKAKADAERPLRHWASHDVYDPRGGPKAWPDGRLPGRRWSPDEVVEMAQIIEGLGWQPGSRIVKDQRDVTIDGHLRADALGLLGIDPAGSDPRTGEPYVEVRYFNNAAARLLFALTANWSTLKAPTKKAISLRVLGDAPLTIEVVAGLIIPLADLMAPPVTAPPVGSSPAPGKTRGPKTLTNADLDLHAQIERSGHVGATSKELGCETSRLARLVDAGLVFVLTQKRDRAAVHVTETWIAGRETSERRVKAAPVKATPPPVEPLPPLAPFTNEAVAAMPWRVAAPQFVHPANGRGNGRIYASTGVRADLPVAEHLDGLIDNLHAQTPWLLSLLCERIAQRDVAL